MALETTNKKQLGFWILTALVAGNMIGSGVFLLPSALAAFGSIGIIAWILTAIGAILLALVFANLSRFMPKAGGPYAYCRAGFGDFIGFLVAYNYWIAVWVGNAAIMLALLGYLTIFWPGLAEDNILAFFVSIAILWFVTFINILGLRQAGLLQVVTTILKIIPLLLVAIFGLFFIHKPNLAVFNVSGMPMFSALTAAAALTLWSFIGLESATIPAQAVKDPEKTIPRATIVGTLVAAVIYILSTTVVMGILPNHALAASTAPYADAARMIFGPWGEWFIAAGAVIATFGALNGWTLLSGQVPRAAAMDGLFPKIFAKEGKSGAPVYGLIISSILITLLLLFTVDVSFIKQFTYIILLATFASLVPYFITAMAELRLLLYFKDEFSPKRFWFAFVIASLAGIYAYWAIAGMESKLVYYGVLLMFSGFPVYVWVKYKASEDEEAEEQEQA